MHELERYFDEIVKSSDHRDLKLEVKIKKHPKLIVIIDCPLPTDSRPKRRSTKLKFLYSKEFVQDHKDIVANTPRNEILKKINAYDFSDATHLENVPPYEFIYIIQTNNEIVPFN